MMELHCVKVRCDQVEYSLGSLAGMEMSSMNPTIKLYNYHVWANKLVFEHLRTLPEDAWSREVKSVFPSIRQLLSHMYAMDTMWLSVMCERPFDESRQLIMKLMDETKLATVQEMEQRFAETELAYRSFFDGHDLEGSVTVTHPVYGTTDTPLSELVQHVVNHGTYHRGNLTAMLHQLGYRGIPTDYAFYMYTPSS